MEYISIIDPIRNKDWDTFIDGHPFGWLYHLSDWKKILEETFPQLTGYYLALMNKEKNAIRAALPLFLVKSRLWRNKFVSIPFTTICDPLVSNIEEMKALLDRTLALSKDFDVQNVEIRMFNAHQYLNESEGEYDRSYVQQYLVLDKTQDELWRTFHKKSVRSRIKRALESGLKLKIAHDEADLGIFYQLYLTTRKRLGLPGLPYTFFKALWQTYYSKDQLSLYLAEYDGKIIAGAVFFKYKKRLSMEFAGTDEKYNKLYPNHFLYWHIIKNAYEEEFEIADMGRTSVFNQSLITFKSRWGAKTREMPVYYYPKISDMNIKPRESTRSYQLIKKINSNSPKFLYHLVSSFYYRHAS
jgi:CelD/BcsL family acetyltransferase involved in cellulose biosynthesis